MPAAAAAGGAGASAAAAPLDEDAEMAQALNASLAAIGLRPEDLQSSEGQAAEAADAAAVPGAQRTGTQPQPDGTHTEHAVAAAP